MENFGSAIFGLAKLKKKGHSRRDEEEKKKENAHDGLFGRIVQCTTTTTCNLIFGFETCLTKLPHQWAKKWKNSAISKCWVQCERCIKIAPLQHKYRAKRGTRAEGVQF